MALGVRDSDLVGSSSLRRCASPDANSPPVRNHRARVNRRKSMSPVRSQPAAQHRQSVWFRLRALFARRGSQRPPPRSPEERILGSGVVALIVATRWTPRVVVALVPTAGETRVPGGLRVSSHGAPRPRSTAIRRADPIAPLLLDPHEPTAPRGARTPQRRPTYALSAVAGQRAHANSLELAYETFGSPGERRRASRRSRATYAPHSRTSRRPASRSRSRGLRAGLPRRCQGGGSACARALGPSGYSAAAVGSAS
jgi:hypothetical protein